MNVFVLFLSTVFFKCISFVVSFIHPHKIRVLVKIFRNPHPETVPPCGINGVNDNLVQEQNEFSSFIK